MGNDFDDYRNSRIVRRESNVGDRGYKPGQIRDHGSKDNPAPRDLKTVLFVDGEKCSR